MTPGDHRLLTARWRSEIIAERGSNEELDGIFTNVPSARDALTTLANAVGLDEWHEAMTTCVEIESIAQSQGWRIAWTEKAEEGTALTLAKLAGVSQDEATDAWVAAAGFAARTALSPYYDDPKPADEVNIGWLLGSGAADAAMDALVVISGEAFVALASRSPIS